MNSKAEFEFRQNTFPAKVRKKISYNLFLSAFVGIYRNYFNTKRRKFGYIHPSARVRFPIIIKGIENIFMYEETFVLGNALIITTKAKFIMKKYSSASEGLTVVTGNHPFVKGEWFLQKAGEKDIQNAKDVIIEEDVGIGANVTLLNGVVVGRGAIIGSGSVVRNYVPPYAIMAGNPAKVVGFRFLPKTIIEHEKMLYPKEERFDINFLNENYQKYFISRINEIKSFLS
jgi:acetyltransferase-like isoleucine patch superfamily enzyme